jgi:PLP dependent protein
MNGRPEPQIPHNVDDAVAQALSTVQAKITMACLMAARPRQDVRLLAVSKTFPAEAVLNFARHGVRAFGENYVQEALAKQERCAVLEAALAEALEWHFIGPIQSNKTRVLAEHFSWVHSIDREKIALRLLEQRPKHLAPLNLCVQVNISDEATKSGCSPQQAHELALSIAQFLSQARETPAGQANTEGTNGHLGPGILRGIMCIPAASADEGVQRAAFKATRELLLGIKASLEQRFPSQARNFDTLSMGMSADLQAAVLEGSTIVRVGSALFGARTQNAAT